jgi:hypothetical protein
VLSNPGGQPVVIDLDDFATGPREWDLIQTAIFYDRFGWHTREEYEAFTKVYGYDIMQWPGYPMLANIREFIMTTWVVQKANEDGEFPAEARKRIDALRTGASRKDWLPFLGPKLPRLEDRGLRSAWTRSGRPYARGDPRNQFAGPVPRCP